MLTQGADWKLSWAPVSTDASSSWGTLTQVVALVAVVHYLLVVHYFLHVGSVNRLIKSLLKVILDYKMDWKTWFGAYKNQQI